MSIVAGCACTFNEVAYVGGSLDGQRLTVLPGAFILPGQAPYHCRLLYQGDTIATTADGTLKLEQNERGLFFQFQPTTPQGREAFRKVDAWELNGVCVGFPRLRDSYMDWGVEVIRRTHVGLITLTVLGCMPYTGCVAAEDGPQTYYRRTGNGLFGWTAFGGNHGGR